MKVLETWYLLATPSRDHVIATHSGSSQAQTPANSHGSSTRPPRAASMASRRYSTGFTPTNIAVSSSK